jgi:tetratricopeptide (TPR) repeat protein
MSNVLRELAATGSTTLLDAARDFADRVDPTQLDRFATILNASANTLIQREAWEEVVELLGILLDKVPDDLRARLRLATSLIQLGEMQRAIEHITHLLSRYPTRPGAAHLLVGNASAGQISKIAEQIVPLTLSHIERDSAALPDGIRVLTYLMSFDAAQQLIGRASVLRDPKLADAAFEYATSANEHEIAEQALREREWAPDTEDEKDTWQIRIALLKADAKRLRQAFDRLTERNKLGLLKRPVAQSAGLSLGRYNEAFSMDWQRNQRPAIEKLIPNLFQPTESIDSLSDANVLIIARTELGDELRLIELVDRARAKFGACTVVVDRRLRDLVSRNRPDLTVVGAEKLIPNKESTVPLLLRRHLDQPTWDNISTFDRVLLITDLQMLLVKSSNDLPRISQLLEPDHALRLDWRKRLHEWPSPRVGLFWHSGPRTFKRSAKFTTLADWLPVFEVCSRTFVSLQYGPEVGREISEAPAIAKIIEMPGLDAKNDINSLAALMCELDLILTIPGTTHHLAGAVGAKTLVVTHPSQALWRARPDSSTSTWSPSVEIVSGRYEDGFAGAIAAAADRLRMSLNGTEGK